MLREWLGIEPHGPFYTSPLPHVPVPACTPCRSSAGRGVPRVVGWDPVYGGPGLVYEVLGQYI